MACDSNQGGSGKTVLWIVFGIVGGFTLLCAGIVVIWIMAVVSMHKTDNATVSKVSTVPAPKTTAKVVAPQQEGIPVGSKAPETAGKDLEGTNFKLSDYHGKVVMLDFWAHW